jgi:NAD(P)-dependent dehydrogenase (short-subunit alcohol dehydrogenase family)
MRLTDKVCIVTGGGSGIGLATVAKLQAEGARVAALDIDQGRAQQSGADLGLACDVGDETSVVEAFDAVLAEFSRLDVVVANAGIAHEVRLDQTTLADWERVLRVNLTGAFLSAKHAVRRMPEGGSIVFHASMSGVVATADEPAYCASKAGVIGLSRAIAVDHARDRIRSNCVCPGVVDTPMTIEQFAPHPDFRRQIEAAHPIGRFAQPAEIAAVTAFLASDESSFVTGAVLLADGGYTAR